MRRLERIFYQSAAMYLTICYMFCLIVNSENFNASNNKFCYF